MMEQRRNVGGNGEEACTTFGGCSVMDRDITQCVMDTTRYHVVYAVFDGHSEITSGV